MERGNGLVDSTRSIFKVLPGVQGLLIRFGIGLLGGGRLGRCGGSLLELLSFLLTEFLSLLQLALGNHLPGNIVEVQVGYLLRRRSGGIGVGHVDCLLVEFWR